MRAPFGRYFADAVDAAHLFAADCFQRLFSPPRPTPFFFSSSRFSFRYALLLFSISPFRYFCFHDAISPIILMSFFRDMFCDIFFRHFLSSIRFLSPSPARRAAAFTFFSIDSSFFFFRAYAFHACLMLFILFHYQHYRLILIIFAIILLADSKRAAGSRWLCLCA